MQFNNSYKNSIADPEPFGSEFYFAETHIRKQNLNTDSNHYFKITL